MVVYGFCNWFTSLRHNVPSFYFGWERYIPFVPLMIVPYMSIDLFFVTAPFLCHDDAERHTLARRLAAATLIAGVCFLCFPLKFAFARPAVGGWLGVVFNKFRQMDHPYNEFPSLHIAFRTILAEFYGRHSRGILNVASAIWFSLIGFSTVLTYQHHVIDVVGGFALAAVCFYVFCDQEKRLPVQVNRRVGIYYAMGAALALAAGLLLRPWGLLLIWPALSLGIVSAAYFGAGPGIFRKKGGKIPWSARLLLWPVLAGQWVSLLYYSRRCRAWDELTPQLWIGRRLSRREANEAVRRGVTAVLDLTGESSETAVLRKIAYRQLPIMDLTAPTPQQIEEGIGFIREHVGSGKVYVHCKIGYSRTAAIAGAYLLATGQASDAEAAVEMLRNARPSIIIRGEAMTAIRAVDGVLNLTAQTALPSAFPRAGCFPRPD